MEWAQVLVIILSVFLAIFLVLAVVLTALLIKVTKQIKSITTKAEKAAMRLESTATNVSMYTSPMMIAKAVKSFFNDKK